MFFIKFLIIMKLFISVYIMKFPLPGRLLRRHTAIPQTMKERKLYCGFVLTTVILMTWLDLETKLRSMVTLLLSF